MKCIVFLSLGQPSVHTAIIVFLFKVGWFC